MDDLTSSINDLTQNLNNLSSFIAQYKGNYSQLQQQMYFYEDWKNWNSPANQMYLKRLAGINPYSDYTTPPMQQPSALNPNAGLSDILQRSNDSLSHQAERRLTRISQRIAFKQLELEDKRLTNEINLTDSKRNYIASQTIYQDLLNYVLEGSKENQVGLSKLELQELYNQVIMSGKRALNYDKELEAMIDKMFNEAEESKARTDSILYDVKNLKPAELRKYADEHNISEEDLKALQYHNSMIEAVDRIADGLGTDKNDTRLFLKGLLFILKNAIVNDYKR